MKKHLNPDIEFKRVFPNWESIKLTEEEVIVIKHSFGLCGYKMLTPLQISRLYPAFGDMTYIQNLKQNTLTKLRIRQDRLVDRKEINLVARKKKTQDFLDKYPHWESVELPEAQKKALIMVYGLTNNQPQTMTEVAKTLGVSRQAVSELVQKALIKLL